MFRLRPAPTLVVACVALGLFGCTGEIAPNDPAQQGSSGSDGIDPSGTGGASVGTGGRSTGNGGATAPFPGGGSNPGGESGNSGGAPTSPAGTGGRSVNPVPPNGEALIPARIRRLANAEYDTTVQVLFGDGALAPSKDFDFPPDARQEGFTLNDAQRVDPVVAKQLAAAATALAATAKERASTLAPCADPSQGEACARSFIESFGAKVYRRPLTPDEIDGPAANDGLLDLYRLGAEGASYADGIELVVRGMLQSAGFLYLTELGSGSSSAGSRVDLTPHELASSLSYMITGGPASDTLVSAAVSGELATPEGRRQALAELLADGTHARRRMVRVIQEWLGIDRLSATAKDSNVYAGFDAVKAPLQRESEEFIAEVLMSSSGTVGELLGADYTYSSGMLEPPLASLYGVNPAQGRIPLQTRRGILNQGAFLSVYAHAHETGPVLRGVAVARRIACIPILSPTELNIVVVPPVPDPAKSTRERFAIHSQDLSCKGCHDKIDPLGFAFEQYDAMGQFRTQEIPPGQSSGPMVDSRVTLAAGTAIDGEYASSDELALALAESAEVRECFARHLFRASVGRSDPSVEPAEEEVVRYWHELWQTEGAALDPAEQGSFERVLVALVQHPLFTQRIVTP